MNYGSKDKLLPLPQYYRPQFPHSRDITVWELPFTAVIPHFSIWSAVVITVVTMAFVTMSLSTLHLFNLFTWWGKLTPFNEWHMHKELNTASVYYKHFLLQLLTESNTHICALQVLMERHIECSTLHCFSTHVSSCKVWSTEIILVKCSCWQQ